MEEQSRAQCVKWQHLVKITSYSKDINHTFRMHHHLSILNNVFMWVGFSLHTTNSHTHAHPTHIHTHTRTHTHTHTHTTHTHTPPSHKFPHTTPTHGTRARTHTHGTRAHTHVYTHTQLMLAIARP